MHELCYAHASHLIKTAAYPKIVQERLCHSTIAITMDLYSPLIDGMETRAAERIDEAFAIANKQPQGSRACDGRTLAPAFHMHRVLNWVARNPIRTRGAIGSETAGNRGATLPHPQFIAKTAQNRDLPEKCPDRDKLAELAGRTIPSRGSPSAG